MTYAPNPEGLRSAFAAERFTFDETSVQFTLDQAGRLAVSAGRIAAGDAAGTAQSSESAAGFEPQPPAPFTQCVPDGEYPVTLASARFDNGEQRLAYARVQIRDADAASWYPALTAAEDARTLKAGEFFGYSSASGDGCFASGDSIVAFALGAANGRYPSYFGYDGAGRVVALLTDFGVVPGIRNDPPPRRSWWQRFLYSGSENLPDLEAPSAGKMVAWKN